jgi:hypothetical protein
MLSLRLPSFEDDVHDVVESMDKLDEELKTYMEPEDVFQQTEDLMVELDRRLIQIMEAYAAQCAAKGMTGPEITRTVAKLLNRPTPDEEVDDPFADDTLE